MADARSLDAVFAGFDTPWEPRIVARINDYDVKIARGEGDFPEHQHDDTDEYFHVLEGQLTLHLPDDGSSVVLAPGDVFVVPRGVRHAPHAEPGTRILMFEPRGTMNTGDADASGTAGIDLDP